MAEQSKPPRLIIVTFTEREYADALNLMGLGVQMGGMSVVHTASHMLHKFSQAFDMAKLVGGSDDRGLSRLGDRGTTQHRGGTSPGPEPSEGDQGPTQMGGPR